MKKWMLLIVCCLLMSVPVVSAQQLIGALDGEFTVEDLQIVFNFPSSWVSTSSGGVFLAETQQDLQALTSSGTPSGFTLTLLAVPVDTFGLDEFDLEEAADAIIAQAEITVQNVTGSTVMARQAVTVSGVNADGRAGIATMWTQDGTLVFFSFGTPESQVTQGLVSTWNAILESVQPLLADDVELEDIAVNPPGLDAEIPSDWASLTLENSIAFFESQNGLDYFTQNGELPLDSSAIFVSAQTLEQLGLNRNSTIEDLIEWTGVDFSERGFTDQGRFVVADQEGFGFSLRDPQLGTGTYSVITLGDDGSVVIYNLVTPDEDSLVEMTPVFLTMLQSASN